jgi:hypothetical protein
MELREFAVSDRWWEGLWGGGHAPLHDPVSQGWRAYPVKGTDRKVVVIGRKGQPLCASIVRMTGRLDVALYDETPEVVAAAIEAHRVGDLDPRFIQIDHIPGWGLEVIEILSPPWGLRRPRRRRACPLHRVSHGAGGYRRSSRGDRGADHRREPVLLLSGFGHGGASAVIQRNSPASEGRSSVTHRAFRRAAVRCRWYAP